MTFRYSSALQELLGNISTNESAALRALTLIGADAVGFDLTSVLPDLRQTMGADLPLEIHTTLYQIYQRTAQRTASSTPLTAREAGHPFIVAPAEAITDDMEQPDDAVPVTPVIPDATATQPTEPDDPFADLGAEYG